MQLTSCRCVKSKSLAMNIVSGRQPARCFVTHVDGLSRKKSDRTSRGDMPSLHEIPTPCRDPYESIDAKHRGSTPGLQNLRPDQVPFSIEINMEPVRRPNPTVSAMYTPVQKYQDTRRK